MNTNALPKKAAVFISLLALGGTAAWWATRGEPAPKVSANATAVAKIQARSGDMSKQEYVAALARQGSIEATNELVKSYGQWSSARETLPAREDILDALYKIESVPLRLKSVLDAISGDPTKPEYDPLWNKAVDRMASTFASDTARLKQEQDLMLMESRERAQRLLGTGMAQFAQSSPGVPSPAIQNLPEEQRTGVCQDLIDLYFQPKTESYRRELQAGIQAACGRDAAVVLAKTANGIAPGELDILAKRDEAIREALSNLGKGEDVVPSGNSKKH